MTHENNASIFFGQFCGNSPFYDPYVTWKTPNPDLTLCLLDTVPSWLPSLFLIVFVLLRYGVLTQKGTTRSKEDDDPFWIHRAAKQLVALVAIAITVAELALVVEADSGVASFYESLAPIVDRAMLVACFVVVIVLTRLSKFDDTVASSSIVFFFWLLHFPCHLLKLQHYARAASAGVAFDHEPLEKQLLVTVSLMAVASLASLVLNGVESGKRLESPLDSATLLSRWTFFWMMPLLWKGFWNPLTLDNLDPLPKKMKIENLIRRFYGKFNKAGRSRLLSVENSEKRKVEMTNEGIEYLFNRPKLPSVLKILPWCHIHSLLFLAFLRIWFILLDLAKSICLGWLIHHMAERPTGGFPDEALEKEWRWKGPFYAVLLFAVSILQPYCHNFFWFYTHRLGLKVQNALTVAIFDKSLRVTAGARQTTTVGEIVNLMSVDARKFYEALQLFMIGLLIPIHILLAMWILYEQIGNASLAGIACLVALTPVNVLIGYKTKKLQEQHMKFKDTRVKKMNEILNSIKVLKFYAWEESFLNQIDQVRQKEMSIFRVQLLWKALAKFITFAAPIFVTIVCFSVFVLTSDESLTAERAFMSLSILNSIRVSLWLFPTSLILNVHMFVSGKRIDAFFTREEIDSDAISNENMEGMSVSVNDASFSWIREEPPFLEDLTFEVRAGEMLAIVGNVGAGKSALLKAILGEMNKIKGIVVIPEKVAYVSQQPWILNGTVKENILFGKNMNHTRYRSIISACALEPDLEIFPAGDETEIGERGINLSGGQKLRISLARAIYADLDLYLLDDPLSAVDSHVGKRIFDKVLSSKGLLGRKSRIIVTNVLTYLSAMDNIICLSQGSISESGSFDRLMNKEGAFSKFIKSFKNSVKEKSEVDDLRKRKQSIIPEKKPLDNDNSGKLITVEQVKHGRVSARMYLTYLKATGWVIASVIVSSFIVSQGFVMGTNFVLSDWVDEIQNITMTPRNPNSTIEANVNSHYIVIYIIIGICSAIALFVASVVHVFGTIAASKRLHNNLATRVLACPMSFFDVTPLGRIMNRFSVDIDIIDEKIPNELGFAYSILFSVIGSLIVISVVKPWFLILIPLLLAGFVAIQRVYIRSARQLRRLESTSRSPIFSLFGESLQGMSVLRAFRMQEHFKNRIRSQVAENMRSAFYMWTLDETLSFILEKFSSIVVLFCALYSILEESTTVGEAGLTITSAIAVVHIIIYCIRMLSNMENSFVAVERVREYSTMLSEAPWRNQGSDSLAVDWPDSGDLVFHNYSTRYRENLDSVLKNLNFRVTGGQRVGIVGRTGAGKSSLTLALFRIIEPTSGSIFIDGIETKDLGLHDLRSKISIIPQEPVIFSGSLRMNIDPFGLHNDEELWRILSLAHLSDFVSSLPEGLDHECVEAGENLSVGQRQLVCLARALLRNSKILVLDEATAAVDLRTDALIQKTIREEFVGATILTIAHRINTIIDYDKVMVLNRGEIVEFDDPKTLMQDKRSQFYGLAKDAGLV